MVGDSMDYYDFLNTGIRALDSLMLEDKFDYNPQAVDKEQMMMDFYFLSGVTSFVPDILSGIDEVDLQDAMRTALGSITAVVKRDLLDAVYEAICVESVHLIDAVNISDDPDEGKEEMFYHYVDLIKSGKSGSENVFFPSTKADTDGFNITVEYSFDPQLLQPFQQWFQELSQHYNEVNDLIELDNSKRREMVDRYFEMAEFVGLMEAFFTDKTVPWDQRFGGGMWGVVCQGWENLYKVSPNNLKQNIHHIDILFSLQHNNGAVLEKVKSYSDANESHAWIKRALDFKFNNREFWNYYDKISPNLKRLAAYAIKSATGKSLDEYVRENMGKQ
jgi:hypothetical protein